MAAESPKVTCIMPTFNRRQFVAQAVRYFLAQDYPERELVIVDDGSEPVGDLVPQDARVRYFRQDKKQALGAKRNFACEQARGEIIVHWDDDDWSAPWRLRYQVGALLAAQADICGLERVFFYAPRENRAWEYVYPGGQRRWVYGASLCYRKMFWRTHRFPEIHVGEDTRFVWASGQARIHPLPDARFLVALVHDHNTSPKRTVDSRYHPKPLTEVENLLGNDAVFYRRLYESAISNDGRPGEALLSESNLPVGVNPTAAVANSMAFDQMGIQASGPSALALPPEAAACAKAKTAKGSLLIAAGTGIGDIIRMTPLIRAAHQLGYAVELLLWADYPEVAQLFDGVVEIKQLTCLARSPEHARHPTSVSNLSGRTFDIAVFTPWSAPLRSQVRARSVVEVERARWLTAGYSSSVAGLAQQLGWQGEMPEPFVAASKREFQLPPGTVALHPGCNGVSPWKRWHGFDELARRFSSVVVIGTQEDVRTENTYFRRPFEWPAHAQNFIGKLNLPDTAALLRACAALVSNDSGLMHLGVALGVPTFGIFGISSPQRELLRSPKMIAITKNLPCEPECRKGAWDRRDCNQHLECLKSLTSNEVFMKVKEMLPEIVPLAPPWIPAQPQGTEKPRETINLIYYGWVFQASGYGQAARSYLHALHQAGINLSVVDLGGGPRAVSDPLIESLVGRKMDADFHLFHGVPPHWARHAFPLANVIAMTVWETDTMPSQWRPALNHALEVWLPCEFNTTVFARALQKPVFKLPHPIPTHAAAPAANDGTFSVDFGVRDDEFVFYSIFEWQDRKGPMETIEAFLRAFPKESGAVLLLKTNASACQIAEATLAEVRKRTASAAKVVLRCEAWSERQVADLHTRGNAYISLHRGEGWNLPLFEAACMGKPIVATGYSGPLEYLNPEAHGLVRHRPSPVRQRYAYYLPTMNWVEPDVEHATELMLQVFHDPVAMARRSAAHADRLRMRYNQETVGAAASERLLQLLRKTNPKKWSRLQTLERIARFKPPVPIPGDWYDADYFENGLKSNWTNGYRWDAFAGLFRDTAEFLATMFPGAQSFLDAGCAKGFLVRTLREKGREAWGFDHSVWALEHAEPSAKPFLRLADVNDPAYDRAFDVLVGFALLEGLTETQCLAFLKNIRPRIRHALVATIFTREEDGRNSLPAPDRDLSHITLRGRGWWHELFLQAGWHQDALHKMVEQNCQRHPLTTRMAWALFVYAPSRPDSRG